MARETRDTVAEREAFAGKALAILRRELPDHRFEYEDAGFRLISLTMKGLSINLGRTFEYYAAAPLWKKRGELTARLRNLVRTFLQTQVPENEVLARLMPKIRERWMIEEARLDSEIAGTPQRDFAYRVVAEHLTLEVGLDLPGGILSVSQADLDKWGMTFEEALTQANRNALLGGVDRFREVQSGVFVSDWRDDYDTSRLHLTEVIGSVVVKGRPVAMIPERGVLLLTGADDPAGLARVAEIAADVLQKPGAATGMAFRLDGGWTPFLPSRDHRAFALLKRLSVDTMASCQAGQTERLVALNEKRGIDVYVDTPVLVTDKADGSRISIASWFHDLDTFLPEVDEIIIGGPSTRGAKLNILGRITWDTAREQLADLMEPVEGYPARWRVRASPSAERLAGHFLEPQSTHNVVSS